MATSGTTAFNPDLATIIEEAYERAGIEGRSGYELRSAVRSLNIMVAEWANIGLNLWTVERGTLALTSGTSQYSLPTDTVDLIEQGILVSSQEYRLKRIGVSEWASIVNKSTPGRPTQVYVERIIAPRLNVWPVPDQAYTMVYWRLRRIQDAGTPDKTLDLPFRFVPAMIAGLAYHLACKKSVIDAQRVELLKRAYDEALMNATYEDRERNSFYIRPRIKK